MKQSIHVKRVKSVVFIVRQTRVLVYFPFATLILRTAVLYFRLALLNATATPFAADKRHAWPRPIHKHIARTNLPPGEKTAETIWCAINQRKHGIDVLKYIFF